MSGTINLATYASQIVLDDSGLQSGLRSADREVKKKTDGISKYLKVGLAGAMASVASAGGTMFGVAKNVSGVADELDKTSMKLGVTTDSLQELRFASGQVGVGQDQLDKALGRLNQRMGLAVEGNDKYSSALSKLGVDMEGVRDGTVSTDEAFMKSIDTLNGMSNSQEQAALASELFGTKLSRDLMPMIEAGSLSVDDLRDKAHELGGVMSGESIDAGVLFADSLDEITTMLGGMKNEIGAQLLPVIQTFLEWIMEYMPQIQATFSFAFEIMETLVTNFIGSIGKLIDWVKNWYNENQETVNAIRESFESFFATVTDFFQGFIQFATKIWDIFGDDITKRAKLAFNMIKDVISGVFSAIEGILKVFTGIFTGDWGKFTEGLRQVWSGLWQVVSSILSTTIKAIQLNIQNFISLVTNSWTTFTDLLKNLWSGMWTGIRDIVADAWGVLSGVFSNLYSDIRAWFTGLITDSIQWGKDLMTGFKDGIIELAMAPVDAIKDTATNVADAFTSFFGIRSPSRLMREFGNFIMDGLAEGVEDGENRPVDAIKGVGAKMADEAKKAVEAVNRTLSGAELGMAAVRSTGRRTGVRTSSGGLAVGRGGTTTETKSQREARRQADRDRGMPSSAVFHDGGWVGSMFKNLQHDEVPAILQQGEFVLSRKMIRDIASASNNNSSTTKEEKTYKTEQVFNISKLEFPNVKNSKDIEDALLNLPRIAKQYVRTT